MATEPALVVPVPGVESLVGDCRRRWDPAAGWGVPAHVTVLHPFVSPPVGAEELAERLPVAVFVDRVWLMAGRAAPDAWQAVVEFSLGCG